MMKWKMTKITDDKFVPVSFFHCVPENYKRYLTDNWNKVCLFVVQFSTSRKHRLTTIQKNNIRDKIRFTRISNQEKLSTRDSLWQVIEEEEETATILSALKK